MLGKIVQDASASRIDGGSLRLRRRRQYIYSRDKCHLQISCTKAEACRRGTLTKTVLGNEIPDSRGVQRFAIVGGASATVIDRSAWRTDRRKSAIQSAAGAPPTLHQDIRR